MMPPEILWQFNTESLEEIDPLEVAQVLTSLQANWSKPFPGSLRMINPRDERSDCDWNEILRRREINLQFIFLWRGPNRAKELRQIFFKDVRWQSNHTATLHAVVIHRAG
jgi:hypothetical protein